MNNHILQDRSAQPSRKSLTTVAILRKMLSTLPDDAPVVAITPEFGCFGSGQPYAIEAAELVVMPEMRNEIPAEVFVDGSESDAPYLVTTEAETQVWPKWTGVVVQLREMR